ncbi:hypothetical protein A9K71_27120 [Mesorhizobium sp. WSM3873]|nr:hypothetical protein A9K71_27120 [Mesorhizobium sp. WSM3873]
MYLFGRDALTPGRGKEFNDKIGNGPWVVGAHVWQMVCHSSVQKFQSARAHAVEKPAAILGSLFGSITCKRPLVRTSGAPGSRATHRRASG